jgi:hypothetical protein
VSTQRLDVLVGYPLGTGPGGYEGNGLGVHELIKFIIHEAYFLLKNKILGS